MTRISLCLIARDCEDTLARGLAAAAPQVDEVCVVDLGSQDGTRSVAEGHGAWVVSHRWDGNGASALEAATALCTGEVILLLDPDELLAEGGRATLEAFVAANAGAIGALPQGPRRSSIADFVLPAERLLPASAGCRFDGRDEPRAIASRGEGETAELELAIEWPESAEFVSEDEAAPEPAAGTQDSCEYWYGLGLSLRMQGKHEEALDAFCEALERATSDTDYVAHLFECTAYCMRSLGRTDDALALMDQIEGAFLDRADTRFAIALLALDTHQFERAEIGFQSCLQLAGQPTSGGPSEAARTGYAAHHNLGVLREMIGMHDEALEYFELALEGNPGYQPSIEGAARVRAELEATSERT